MRPYLIGCNMMLIVLSVWTAQSANLSWTGTQSMEWNTVHSNWVGGRLFQSGDSAVFPSTASVFIGLNGVSAPVSPSRVTLSASVTFSGGDILTGGITNDSANLVFTNYAQSLSFPGGLAMQRTGSFLTYDVVSAPNTAQLHLGTGQIVFSPSSWLILLVGPGKGVEFGNDLIMEDQSGVLLEQHPGWTNGTARFTGSLFLNGNLNINNAGSVHGRPPGNYGPFPDTIAGPVVLSQASPRLLAVNLSGFYGYRPLDLSGRIMDGSGTASNRLEFSNFGMFAFRITGTNNTYRHGTRIQFSPGTTPAPIEVAPASSLGMGDVLVEGPLRLRGSRNIHSNAAVRLPFPGHLILDPGVKIRLAALQLGASNYTAGRFSSSNALGYILGDGEFRLPSTNLPPTISWTGPALSTVYAGSDVTFQAVPNDSDGRITKVEYAFWDNILIRTTTNGPWMVTMTNVASDIWVRATAFDDDGAYAITDYKTVRVIDPPAPQIRNPRLIGSNAIAFEFNAQQAVKYSVERRHDFSTGAWSRLYPLPLYPTSTVVILTNQIPPEPRATYFRLRAGTQ